jgi:hypothetical protein
MKSSGKKPVGSPSVWRCPTFWQGIICWKRNKSALATLHGIITAWQLQLLKLRPISLSSNLHWQNSIELTVDKFKIAKIKTVP